MSSIDPAMVVPGTMIKATGAGKFAGWAVWFTDADHVDCDGEWFSEKTIFEPDLADSPKVPLLLSHGRDKRAGNKRLGKGKLSRRREGVFIEGEFAKTDDPALREVIRDCETLIAEERMFISTAGPGHMMEKERQPNGSVLIRTWNCCEASLTSFPCSGGSTRIQSVKSFKALSLDEMLRQRGMTETQLRREKSQELMFSARRLLKSAQCGSGCACESCDWLARERQKYTTNVVSLSRSYNDRESLAAMKRVAGEELVKVAGLRVEYEQLLAQQKQQSANRPFAGRAKPWNHR